MRPKGAVVKVHVRFPLIDAELGVLLKYRHYTQNPRQETHAGADVGVNACLRQPNRRLAWFGRASGLLSTLCSGFSDCGQRF